MRLIKKLSMLLAISAPLALGCGSNQQQPQVTQTTQPTQTTGLPPVPPAPTPPPSIPPPTGGFQLALITGAHISSTGGPVSMLIFGADPTTPPTVTFYPPNGGPGIASPSVMLDPAHASTYTVLVPNFQSMHLPIGTYRVQVTNPVGGGAIASGANQQIWVYAQLMSFNVSMAPSLPNILGDGQNPAHPEDIILADLDGNGKKELVVANTADKSISTLLSVPFGSTAPVGFNVSTTPTSVSNPTAIVAGDINADGKMDLVVASKSSQHATSFIGNGNGTFSLSPTDLDFCQVSNADATLMEDINADQKPDLLCVGQYHSQVGLLSMHGTGQNNGAFDPATVHFDTFGQFGPQEIAEGRFVNGDNFTDLVLANSSQLLLVSNHVDPSDGDNHFVAGATYPLADSVSIRSLNVGDLNGDGLTDVVVSGAPGHSVQMLASDARYGSFTSKTVVHFLDTHDDAGDTAIGDFNGDGIPDLAVLTPEREAVSIIPGIWTDWKGDPGHIEDNNNLGPLYNRALKFDDDHQTRITVEDHPSSIVAVDVNGDGLCDLLVSNRNDGPTVDHSHNNGDINIIMNQSY